MASAAADFPRDPTQPLYRQYLKEPAPGLHQELLEFSKQTAHPEEFPGLHPGPIPRDEPFVILGNIDVEKSRRPSDDRIPCAMCTPNRFLHGKFIYVPRLQCVTIIGHCCADKDTLDNAVKTFDAKIKAQSEENYLLKALPLVGAKLQALATALPKANEAKRLHKLLHRNAPHIVDYLRGIRRENGALVVSAEAQVDDEVERFAGPAGFRRNETERHRTTQIGILRGLCVSLGSYEPDFELTTIRQALAEVKVDGDDEEIFYFVADLIPRDRETYTTLLRNIDRNYSRFAKRLNEFAAFFEADNISLLNKWGRHPDNLLNIHAHYESPYGVPAGTKRLEIGNPQGRTVMLVSVVLSKALPAWEYVSYD